MPDSSLEHAFHAASLDNCKKCRTLKPAYRPSAWEGMIAKMGAVRAAEHLLSSKGSQAGLFSLYERPDREEAMKLSVEWLVLQPRFSLLFDEQILEEARRRIVELGLDPPTIASTGLALSCQHPLAEELPPSGKYSEGQVASVLVNAYERSKKARKACIAFHGHSCGICGFDFEAEYGPQMSGFIHVHHLTPISEIGGEYEVDAEKDLMPICPNCHAAIHAGGGCRTPKQIQSMRKAARNAKLQEGG